MASDSFLSHSKSARGIEQVGTKNDAEKSGHGTENRDDSTGGLKMATLQSPASVVIPRQCRNSQEYPEDHECYANSQRYPTLLGALILHAQKFTKSNPKFSHYKSEYDDAYTSPYPG